MKNATMIRVNAIGMGLLMGALTVVNASTAKVRTGNAAAAVMLAREAEPGDDRGNGKEAEPGDDRGRGKKPEPGDDRGRHKGKPMLAREHEPQAGDDRGGKGKPLAIA